MTPVIRSGRYRLVRRKQVTEEVAAADADAGNSEEGQVNHLTVNEALDLFVQLVWICPLHEDPSSPGILFA